MSAVMLEKWTMRTISLLEEQVRKIERGRVTKGDIAVTLHVHAGNLREALKSFNKAEGE